MKMDPFVRRLVERMLDPSSPLSRNRHFHTFATPEGRRALRLVGRIRSLERDIAACLAEGGSPQAVSAKGAGGEVQVEVRLDRIKTAHRAKLDRAEFELLCRLPGARQAFVKPG